MSTAAAERVVMLDAGGVILTEPMDDVLSHLALASSTPRQILEKRYRRWLYAPFWAGELSEAAFWGLLSQLGGSAARPAELKAIFEDGLRVQPDVRNTVKSWSGAHLEILSNHRSRWLRPLLEEAGLLESFNWVHISEELGLAKPQAAIFRYAARGLPANSAVLYVDDSAENLRAAESATTWRTSLAAADQSWTASVAAWLAEAERP